MNYKGACKNSWANFWWPYNHPPIFALPKITLVLMALVTMGNGKEDGPSVLLNNLLLKNKE